MNRERLQPALISVGCCLLSIFVLYFAYGPVVSETAEVARESLQAQRATEERVGEYNLEMVHLKHELQNLQAEFPANTQTSEDVAAMKARLSELEGTMADVPQLASDLRQQLKNQEIDLARQHAELIRLSATLRKCKSALAKTYGFVTKWDKDFASLTSDDRGKKIASSPRHVARLSTTLSQDHPDTIDYDAWSEEFASASRLYIEAKETGESIPVGNEVLDRFESFLARVKAANTRLFHRQSIVERTIEECARNTMAPMTLADAIVHSAEDTLTMIEDENAKQRRAQLKEFGKQESAKIQKAIENRIAEEARLKTAKEDAKRLQLAKDARRIEDGNADTEQKLKEQRLLAEFLRDEPEVKSLLKPFITPSDRQPTRGDTGTPDTWIFVSKPVGPVSWGNLSGSGALDDTPEGRKRLLFVGGGYMSFRPRGSFPGYSLTALNNPNVVRQVQRARGLLLKYGQVLQDRGLMKP